MDGKEITLDTVEKEVKDALLYVDKLFYKDRHGVEPDEHDIEYMKKLHDQYYKTKVEPKYK